jgi:hypothetical protein
MKETWIQLEHGSMRQCGSIAIFILLLTNTTLCVCVCVCVCVGGGVKKGYRIVRIF